MSSSGALAAIEPTPTLRGRSLEFSIGIEGVDMIRSLMDFEVSRVPVQLQRLVISVVMPAR